MAAVGDGGGQIGDLQRSGGNLSLPDGDGNDGQRVPGFVVVFVVVVGIGDHASLLTRQICSQPIAESHGYEMVFPTCHGSLDGTVLPFVAEQTVEVPAEIGVARGPDGRNERSGGAVAVTAQMKSFVVEAVVAGKSYLRVDAAFLKSDEGLREFERGAGGIGSHRGTVEQGLVRVTAECAVDFSAFPSHQNAGVVSGRRSHAENLAGGRLDGNDRPQFALKQAFGQCLQVHVDAERDVLARNGSLVVFPVLVMALCPASGVAQHDAHSFFAA